MFNSNATEAKKKQSSQLKKIPEILERFLKPFVLLWDLEKRRRNIELRLSVQQVWNATRLGRLEVSVEGHWDVGEGKNWLSNKTCGKKEDWTS